MALVARCFGRGVSLALFRQDVDQHRPGGPRLHRAQNGQKLVQVMPVNRADVVEPQCLEQRAANGHAFQHVLGALGTFLQRGRQQAEKPLRHLLEILHRGFGIKPRQIGRQRPHRRRNRHLVVIQDHEQPFAQMARVVHRLERHAGRHGPVADHRYRIARITPKLCRHGKAQRRGNRGRAMRRTERIIGAFRPSGIAAKAPFRPQRANPVAPPGQDLVRIALVAHIPDQLVARGVEHGMDCHRQFNHTKASAKVPTRHRNRSNRLGPQLARQLVQLAVAQGFQVGWQGHAVKKGGFGSVGHACLGFQVSREITKRAASIKLSARLP